MTTEAVVDNEVKKATEASLEQLETETTQESVPDPVETKAREKGWKPLEEFDGDPETFVPAKEYVEREPLYKALHKANREIKKMKETLSTFKEHYTKVEINAKQVAIKELQAQLNTASEERDIGKALEIKDKITELSTETKAVERDSNTNDYDSWIVDNKWYETDKALKTAATGIGFGLNQEHPDWPMPKIYEEVTKIVKETFPDKFINPNKGKVNKVTSGNKTINDEDGTKRSLPSFSQLPEEARKNYRRLVKSDKNPHGILSHAEFIKDYLAVGGTTTGE